MQTRNWQQVLWTFVYAILLLSMVTPFGILTIHFLILPMTLVFVKLHTKGFTFAYLAAFLPVIWIASFASWYLAIVSLFFVIPAIMMGRLYKRKAEAKVVLISGMVTIIVEMLVGLIALTLLGFDPYTWLSQYMNGMPELWKSNFSEEVLRETTNYMVLMIPTFIIFFAVYMAVITHGMARFILNKTGEQLPGLKPIREWMLPRSFVWYYILALLFTMFLPEDSQSFWNTILLNLVPLLMAVFTVQGIGFLFYITHLKRWSKALPIIAAVLSVFVPFLMYGISLLGVFDVLLNIRKSIRKP